MNPRLGNRPLKRALEPRQIRCSAASLMLLLSLWHNGSPAEEAATLRYFLVPGDNPWNITERFLHGMQYWQPLLRLNNIERPRQLPPGTGLTIPLSWLKTEAATTRVMEVAGDASYTSAADGRVRPLQQGTLLTGGDRIHIGEQGSAILEYIDGTRLFLGRNTEVSLERVNRFSDSGFADSEVKLDSGRTENRVEKRGTRFEIKTPSASTAVRGTRFRASVDSTDNRLSRFEVLAGSVAVDGAGSSRNIAAGFGTTVVQGEPPSPPKPLLAPPKIISPAAYSRAFPLEISWQPVKGAQQYRLQVKARGSDTPLVDEVTTRSGLSTNALEDGHFTLVLRAIDSHGLEGREMVQDFQLDAQPQPPLTVTPESAEVVRSKLPAFEWTRPLGGRQTHFQLTRDKQSPPLIDIPDHPDTHFVPEYLAPGSYYWRLATRNENEEGPWGEYQAFTLRPAPGEPKVSSEGDERQIRLRWPDAGEGRSYRVQISDESDFKTTTEDRILDEPTWEAERPLMPSYFRVRTIDIDGYEGAWSTPQMIDPVRQPWYLYVLPPALLMLLVL